MGITGTPVIDPARRELRNSEPRTAVRLDAVTGAPRMSVDVDPAGDVCAALLGDRADAVRRPGGVGSAATSATAPSTTAGSCPCLRAAVPAFFTVTPAPQSQGAVVAVVLRP